MEILSVLSNLLAKWRRRKWDDASQWVEVWEGAFVLAHLILDDKADAASVANNALLSFRDRMNDIRHRERNRGSYSRRVARDGRLTRARKFRLPDHLELAGFVCHFSTEKELQRMARGAFTTTDLDVWYIKYNLQYTLACSNAFSAAVSMSCGIHAYSLDELSSIWFELVGLAPRRREPWEDGNEPFERYWRKLKAGLKDRFGGLIVTSSTGDITRRPQEQQPRELVTRCVRELTMQTGEEPCAATATPNGAGPQPGDLEAEERRFNTFLRRPCFTDLIKQLRQSRDVSLPDHNLGLPQYTITMSSNTPSPPNRRPPPLTEEERQKKSEELENLFRSRRDASADLVVTVDGAERPSAGTSLGGTGRARLRADESAGAVEVWARGRRGDRVLLTSCLLRRSGGKEVAVLEGGQRLFFRISYVEDEAGDGAYDIALRYCETGWRRRVALARRRRRTGGAPRAGPGRVLIPTMAAAALGFLFVVAGLILPRLDNDVSQETSAHMGLAKGGAAPARSPEQVGKSSEGAPTATGSDEADREAGLALPVESSAPSSNTENRSPPPPPVTTGRSGKTSSGASSRMKNAELLVKTVAPVKRIYVERPDVFDDPDLNLAVYAEVVERLKQSEQFVVVEDPESAQARLVLVSGHRSALREKVRPQLLTTGKGKLIWEGPLIPISDEESAPDATPRASAVGRTITDALIQQKEEETSPAPRRPAPRRRPAPPQ